MQVTGNNQHSQHTLSIRISTDGFSFYVFCPQEEIPFAVFHFDLSDEDIPEYMQKCFEQAHLDAYTYDRVYALASTPSTRIPLEDFRKDEADPLYRLTFPDTAKTDKVFYNILPHVETAELFSLPSDVSTWLCRRFPDIRIYGQYSMLLERLMGIERRSTSCRNLYVYLEDKRMFACQFRDGRLTFANTYMAEDRTNRLYFILHAWKTLGANAEQDRCILLNASSCQKGMAEDLQKYLRHVVTPGPADLFPRLSASHIPGMPFDLFMLLTND